MFVSLLEVNLLERCVARAHRRSRFTVHHSYFIKCLCLGNHPAEEEGLARTGWWLQICPVVSRCRDHSLLQVQKSIFGFDTKLPGNTLRKGQTIPPNESDMSQTTRKVVLIRGSAALFTDPLSLAPSIVWFCLMSPSVRSRSHGVGASLITTLGPM
jgi:hypothetical protein